MRALGIRSANSFVQRWCVLTPDFLLYYVDKQSRQRELNGDQSTRRGTISLIDVNLLPFVDPKLNTVTPYTFRLDDGSRVYTFCAEVCH